MPAIIIDDIIADFSKLSDLHEIWYTWSSRWTNSFNAVFISLGHPRWPPQLPSWNIGARYSSWTISDRDMGFSLLALLRLCLNTVPLYNWRCTIFKMAYIKRVHENVNFFKNGPFLWKLNKLGTWVTRVSQVI